MNAAPRLLLLWITLLVAGCALPEGADRREAWRREVAQERQELHLARASLKRGLQKRLSPGVRAGYLLDAAAEATELWTGVLTPREERVSRRIYNRATAGLTELLRKHPQLLSGESALVSHRGSAPYRLLIQGPSKAVWDFNYFTRYFPARTVSQSGFRQRVIISGYGAAMVGERSPTSIGLPRDPFTEHGEVNAAVTAILDFPKTPKSKEKLGVRPVTLTLYNPLKISEVALRGKKRTLAADFTAPLAAVPRSSEFWAGLESMLNVERYLRSAGLHRYEPFDPDRIPVVFIHGLASTPQMWLEVINDLNADPKLRERYQPWVFRYPSGLPAVYSAMGLREQLRDVQKEFPMPNGYLLVGHSMGGLVARLQVSTVERGLWDAALGKRADELYRKVDKGSLLKRAMLFDPDPKARRVIFICTPHRGSQLASGSLGGLATSLIRLPAFFIRSMENTVGGSLELLTGVQGKRFPTSIQSLSPTSPTLAVINEKKPTAPHHSIIGDRGRGDTPNSSDGVVPYWSSHLDSAISEVIVPGPHGSYNYPQAIDELKRILEEQPKAGATKR